MRVRVSEGQDRGTLENGDRAGERTGPIHEVKDTRRMIVPECVGRARSPTLPVC